MEAPDYRFQYNMMHKKRGLFILINNKKFDPITGMNERAGTDADAANLHELFKTMGFNVESYKDRSCKQMLEILREG